MKCKVSVKIICDELDCCDYFYHSVKCQTTDDTITFSHDEFKDLMDNIVAESQKKGTLAHWQIITES